ncbi:MAG TPA: DUF6798 domain-containing protein [Pirellulaceae bacterium]|jgi:hypothetical protein|nr:DUF6798 domain-containing protein [Pirellulaceae bacterium]
MKTSPNQLSQPSLPGQRQAAIEVFLLVGLMFLIAGGIPPGVNEAHYLAKAKHYWIPSWCPSDPFLQSVDAHLIFYWTIGWLTLFLPLWAVAWIGRFVTWFLLAWSWRRLSERIVPGNWWALLTLGLYACFLSCGHLAGEWVFGGVEAKGFAYALLFLALEALLQGRWNRVWLLLGAASSFHVLTGGWSVIAAMFVWLCSSRERPTLQSMWPALLGGLVLALPGLLPAIALTWGVDKTLLAEANELYVHRRLSHHLVFHKILMQPLSLDFEYLGLPRMTLRLTHTFFLRHLALVLAWATLCWRVRWAESRRFHLFVAGAGVIACVGILIDQLTLARPDLSVGLLRYYWFRLSDAIIPAGLAMACGQVIHGQLAERERHGWLIAAVVLVSLFVGDAYFRRYADPRPEAVIQAGTSEFDTQQRFADWTAACRWITDHTDEDEIVLTPRGQQTFKWYAARGEVVNWKDIPQDAMGIKQWWRRHNEVYPPEVRLAGLVRHDLATLRGLANYYGFRYVIIDRAKSATPHHLLRVFPPRTGRRAVYEVYRLPPEASNVTLP